MDSLLTLSVGEYRSVELALKLVVTNQSKDREFVFRRPRWRGMVSVRSLGGLEKRL